LRARLLCCVALATLAFLASPAPAWAQQCTFVTPTYATHLDATGASIRVTATCNGGIFGCKGRVTTAEYVWNPITLNWDDFATNPSFDAPNRNVLCGSNDTFGQQYFRSWFPAGHTYAIAMSYYAWNGTAYVYLNSGTLMFSN
jgi:hypothetical protein